MIAVEGWPAFAENLADYMLTRDPPWKDETEMREAVRTAVRLVFAEAVHDTVRILNDLDRWILDCRCCSPLDPT